MDAPFFSIVTPSFNQLSYLKACVASVEMQTGISCEHLVLDGGSTDGSREYLEQNPGKVSWWRSHRDRGQSHALNEGFERARGTWVGWQNSDDFYYPGVLALVARISERFPQARVIVGDTALVDEQGVISSRVGVAATPAIKWLKGYWPYNQAVFFHRDLLRAALPVDESLSLHMDTDLLAKVALARPAVAYTPLLLGAFRKHALCKTESADIQEKSNREREILRARYQEPLWPAGALRFQAHRLAHHGRNLMVWGPGGLLERYLSRRSFPLEKRTVVK